MLKFPAKALTAAVLGFGLICTTAMSAHALQVNVDFSPELERYIPRIDAIEKQREEQFRQTLTSTQRPLNSVFRFNRQQLEGTDWAGQRLIDSVDQYTVENLIQELIEDNLARLDVALDDRIEVRIDQLRVANYSVSRIGASNTYVKGEIRWLAGDGALRGEKQLTANFVKIPVLDKPYTGERYAFGEPDETNRVGPVLSHFVERALGYLFPEQKDRIYGPVLVKYLTPTGGALVSP